MDNHGIWHEKVASEIYQHQLSLTKKEYKKYKLGKLLKIAGRVDEFSATCGECQLFQPQITRLTKDVSNLVQMPRHMSKQAHKSYFKTIGDITKHLQKQHKLVTKGQYIGMWMAIGTGIGTAIGAALENPGIGTAIGVAIGLAIGSYLDRKAKEEGRVL